MLYPFQSTRCTVGSVYVRPFVRSFLPSFICLPVFIYPSAYRFSGLSWSLFRRLFVFFLSSLRRTFNLSINPSVSQPVGLLSVCVPACMPACLRAYLFACLSVCMSARLPDLFVFFTNTLSTYYA